MFDVFLEVLRSFPCSLSESVLVRGDVFFYRATGRSTISMISEYSIPLLTGVKHSIVIIAGKFVRPFLINLFQSFLLLLHLRLIFQFFRHLPHFDVLQLFCPSPRFDILQIFVKEQSVGRFFVGNYPLTAISLTYLGRMLCIVLVQWMVRCTDFCPKFAEVVKVSVTSEDGQHDMSGV
jgi:hypothetical protein